MAQKYSKINKRYINICAQQAPKMNWKRFSLIHDVVNLKSPNQAESQRQTDRVLSVDDRLKRSKENASVKRESCII